MTINDCGIEIMNNKSRVVENLIEKSHENGIKILGADKNTRCMPRIWKNRITSCGFNGILCQGDSCEPDIRGNVIDSNRKSGIKLCEQAAAHIGGTAKDDLNMFVKQTPLPQQGFLPQLEEQTKKNNKMQQSLFSMSNTLEATSKPGATLPGGNSTKKGAPTAGETPGGDALHVPKINVKSFYNSNTISQNFNQGILLVEGSFASIIANKIDKNIKANIALGGEASGNTRILYNLIENSKSEGIFVIEGEDKLNIEENEVVGNHDGIVLVESKGTIKGNVIKENQRSGILTSNNTRALLEANIIEENWTAGVLIKDPSLPEMRKNEISKNYYQVQRIQKF